MNTAELPGWGSSLAYELLQTISVEQLRAGIFPAYLEYLNERKMRYQSLAELSQEKITQIKAQGTVELISTAMRTELPLVPHYISGIGTHILALVRVDETSGEFLLGSGAVVGTVCSAESGTDDEVEVYSPFSSEHFGLLLDQVVAMDDLGLKCVNPITGGP